MYQVSNAFQLSLHRFKTLCFSSTVFYFEIFQPKHPRKQCIRTFFSQNKESTSKCNIRYISTEGQVNLIRCLLNFLSDHSNFCWFYQWDLGTNFEGKYKYRNENTIAMKTVCIVTSESFLVALSPFCGKLIMKQNFSIS